jgi:hypothetical protein
MTLPGGSSFPAESPEKLHECDSAGAAMRNLLEKNILPRDIMTRSAFENAMVCSCLSLPSVAVPHAARRTPHSGINHDPGRLHERSSASHCHRALGRHQARD